MNAMHRDLERLAARAEQEGAALAASDPARQRFHLQPPTGWLNDPNGLCQAGGRYHAYFQYAPFSPDGSGVRHWGHAVSTDLIRWQRQPCFLYPDQPFDVHGVYSGSALVEEDGISFFYTGNVKYSGDFDYIHNGRAYNTCLATSRDGTAADGKRLVLSPEDYPAGLTPHVRDPKVWRQDGRYYMVLGARTTADAGEVLVYQSPDKLAWTLLNRISTPAPFGYMWECPDLFELDGQWFLAVSPQGVEQKGLDYQNVYTSGYFPLYGDWRGECRLGEFVEFDHGFDFYAPQSFRDERGRRIQIGWMGMPDAGYTNPVQYGWQHCMTIPCELTVREGRLLRRPVEETERLRGAPQALPLEPGAEFEGERFDLLLSPAKGPLRLTLRGCVTLEYSDGVLSLRVGPQGGFGRENGVRRAAVRTLRGLRILADSSSAEVFVNDGETVLSTRYYPAPGQTRSGIQAGTGTAVLYPIE